MYDKDLVDYPGHGDPAAGAEEDQNEQELEDWFTSVA
jgi:hypothetical protein